MLKKSRCLIEMKRRRGENEENSNRFYLESKLAYFATSVTNLGASGVFERTSIFAGRAPVSIKLDDENFLLNS